MKIELLFLPGCEKCVTARKTLKAVAQQLVPLANWRELNALEELDYAFKLGVVVLPSIAIDGKLAFSSLPTSTQFRKALTRAMTKSSKA